MAELTREQKRGQSIAKMGLVSKVGWNFKVSSPVLRGHQTHEIVSRDRDQKTVCTCLHFQDVSQSDSTFRCEHIQAVKYFLTMKSK